MLRKVLLVCGILASMLYVAMNVIVAMQWEGYNSVSQTIGELSAIGAPTRPLWVLLGPFHTVLVTAFGWGVWERISIAAFMLWDVVLAVVLLRIEGGGPNSCKWTLAGK